MPPLLAPELVAERLAQAPPSQPIRLSGPGRPWTISDLDALPDDGNHYELVRGELMIASPASPLQGRYASRLIHALVDFVDEHDLGEVYTAEPGFVLQPEPKAIVRSPDVAFVRTDRIPPPEQQTGFWPVAPDLVVEIASPSDRADAIDAKIRDYLEAGTRLLWAVFPANQTVAVHQHGKATQHLDIDDQLDGGDLLPGFTLPLRRLYR